MMLCTIFLAMLAASVPSSAAPTTLTKRGSGKAGISWPVQEVSADPVAKFFAYGSNIAWWYDWNKNYNTVLPGSSAGLQISGEFIPCMFQPGFATSDVPLQGGHKEIMGYNEPERIGVSPEAAAADWVANIIPRRAAGITLASPSVANDDAGKGWLRAFFNIICPGGYGPNGFAGCPNAPDHLAINVYAKSFEVFQAGVEQFHNSYGLPIIVKEFAAEDFSGNPPLSQQQVYDFMGQTTLWLDQTPWVVKYAWFGAMRNSAWLYGVAEVNRLMDSDGNVTPLGWQYFFGGHR